MKLLKYDAMTIGNHEFDNGVKSLIDNFLKNLETENGPAFPVVACNIINDEEFNFNNYYRKSTVIVKNNVKIGIIGFITPRTKSISNTGKLIFEDAIVSIEREASRKKFKDN
jgi:2',3'-cyclic-nucleotide 2'-phosphodiesterase (5'-nucleotidase family)